MDVHNNLDGLRSLLGVQSPSTASASTRSGVQAGAAGANELTGDQATLSSAGSEVSLESASDGVRMDKVAAVQAALAAGTYNVPASSVAAKMVDAMLVGAN